ncbi:MAG TPA: membrane dipeptidase [Caldithrix sp.]|nr:membrane dipeptidase [Caldithrix sp.]
MSPYFLVQQWLFIKTILIFAFFFIGLSDKLQAQVNYQLLHKNALVADLHNDALYSKIKGNNIESELKYSQFDLVAMRNGGVDVQFFAVWPDPNQFNTISPYQQAVAMIDSFDAVLQRQSDKMAKALNQQNILDIISTGKTAACLGLEGGEALENNLERINYFYKRGVRYIGLTWNNSLVWASSARDESSRYWKGKKGLGSFGRLVVERMNELGIMIDLAHAGEQTFYDVVQHSTKPVIVSHSSVYSICPHYRNLKDDQIRALAKNDGVLFINFFPGYLVKGFDKVYRNARKQADVIQDSLKMIEDHAPFNRAQFIHHRIDSLYPGVSVVVDHIEYVINLVGEDYVGLGSDYCGMAIPPAGLENVSKLPNITRELLRRGYTEETIKKILGGNFMRVFKQVTHSE